MLNTLDIIGKNIRSLRKSHKETQEELGKVLNVSKSTISMYENGNREVDADSLHLIAKHYGITAEELMYSIIPLLDYQQPQITWDKLIDFTEAYFPIISTPEALQNPEFTKGYEILLDLFDRMRKNPRGILTGPILDRIKECFYVAMKDSSCSNEAAANLLSFFFLEYSTISDKEETELAEAVMSGKGQKPDFTKKYILKNNTMIGKRNEQKQKYAKTHNKIIALLITKLKQSPNYSDLADYYIALRYLFDFCDNNLSPETNKLIGKELIKTFANLDNRHVKNLFIQCEKL